MAAHERAGGGGPHEIRLVEQRARRRLRHRFGLRRRDVTHLVTGWARDGTLRVAVALTVPPGEPPVELAMLLERTRIGWQPVRDEVEVTVGIGTAEKWGTAHDAGDLEAVLAELRDAYREHRHPQDVASIHSA